MKAIGIRSVLAMVLVSGSVVAMWQMGLARDDYWNQLDPWAAFVAGVLAMLAGTLIFQFWRLGERSQYYLRIGQRSAFGEEIALGPPHGTTLLVGRAAHVSVIDFPPLIQRTLWVAILLAIALITVDNRAVAMLRDVPHKYAANRSAYCKPAPPPPKVEEEAPPPGCKLVKRAYDLGYTKSLGSCAPKALKVSTEPERRDVCRLRQQDEPYIHYAWRLLDKAVTKLTTDDGAPGVFERLGTELDVLDSVFRARLDSVAMSPRSSHHLFTNLPDPRESMDERVSALLERGCGARLAQLAHFPPIEDTPEGPSKLLEHVLAQLLFNPTYRPIVAQCEELTVHWNAPRDACSRLANHPTQFLGEVGALDDIVGVLSWRDARAELARLGHRTRELAAPQRVISLQCLIVDDATAAAGVTVHKATINGEQFTIREARIKRLTADDATQIRLYKHLGDLLTEGFGYGQFTSAQALGAAPEETAVAASFGDPIFLLTKLDLLRDADLFLGNEWLAKRHDLLEVYPFHLHLQNYVQLFRRQYQLKRGRL